MATYLGKSCSFGLPRVPLVICRQFMYCYFPFGFDGSMWDLVVSVPDHCLSFYFDPIFNTISDIKYWPLQAEPSRFLAYK